MHEHAQHERANFGVIAHDLRQSGVHDFAIFGAGMEIPDPDGTVVRVVWMNRDFPAFVGVDSDENGGMHRYFSPA
jgi:hypothetical protein